MQPERFRLLASALAGRPLEVATAEPGRPAWTDGSTVYIDAGAPVALQLQAVGVQACLLAAGSLEPHIVSQLVRRPALAQRYLALEAHRALAVNEEVLPPRLQRLLDRDIAARVATADAALALARTRQARVEVPAAFGTIDARHLLASFDRRRAASATADVARVAPPGDGATLAELAGDDDNDGNVGTLLSSPVGGGGAVGRLLSRLFRPARDPNGGGPPGADAPTRVSTDHPGAGRRAVASTTAPGPYDDTLDDGGRGRVYPEWDVHRRAYRPAWCTVIERDPLGAAGPTAAWPDAVALRRPLARLGIGLDHCRRQRQGDDIDIDAAVETWVDSEAGSPHDDDFYVDNLRRRRDLAVLILLDVSGSAGEPGVAGATVHEHQRAAAAALVSSLHALGDRVALYAFNSRGRRAVQVARVKSFDDHLDARVTQRLARLAPGAYTRLGAAIRHGTAILEDRAGTPRRLLVVLSDGLAYDHGYEHRYGEADARRALLEARRRGVGCLCLSVGTDVEPAALQRVFGTAAHATVPRTEQLPALIGPLFRAALRSAEAKRRAYTRTERTRERLELERRTDGSSGPAVLRPRR